ncbi:hypothetical protein Tco_0003487 [Tanacetum coccineum]
MVENGEDQGGDHSANQGADHSGEWWINNGVIDWVNHGGEKGKDKDALGLNTIKPSHSLPPSPLLGNHVEDVDVRKSG